MKDAWGQPIFVGSMVKRSGYPSKATIFRVLKLNKVTIRINKPGWFHPYASIRPEMMIVVPLKKA